MSETPWKKNDPGKIFLPFYQIHLKIEDRLTPPISPPQVPLEAPRSVPSSNIRLPLHCPFQVTTVSAMLSIY